jgi:hypothetical protein
MRSMTVPMPSPLGTNKEGLFLRTRIMSRSSMAYDADPHGDVDVMALRDALVDLLKNEFKLSDEQMAKFYECFDWRLDAPAARAATDKRKAGYDSEPLKKFLTGKGMSEDDIEHLLSLPRNGVNNPGGALTERPLRQQAMDRAMRGGSSSYSSFERRHPEVAHIKHT